MLNNEASKPNELNKIKKCYRCHDFRQSLSLSLFLAIADSLFIFILFCLCFTHLVSILQLHVHYLTMVFVRDCFMYVRAVIVGSVLRHVIVIFK